MLNAIFVKVILGLEVPGPLPTRENLISVMPPGKKFRIKYLVVSFWISISPNPN
jgi:hypothetical protein